MMDNDDTQMFWACVKEEAERWQGFYPKIIHIYRSAPNVYTIKIATNKLRNGASGSNFSPVESLIVRARCRLIASFADQLCYAFNYSPKPMKASGDFHEHFHRMLERGFDPELELQLAHEIRGQDLRSLLENEK